MECCILLRWVSQPFHQSFPFLQVSKAKKFKLDSVRFEEIFAGPVPKFEFSEIKVRKLTTKKAESRDESPGPSKKAKDKGAEGKEGPFNC